VHVNQEMKTEKTEGGPRKITTLTKVEIKESDILEAMTQGQEVFSLVDVFYVVLTDWFQHLGMVKLTCTSYDHVLAEDIRMMKTGSVTKFIHPESGLGLSNPKSASEPSTSSLKGTSVRSRRSAKNQVEEDSEESSNESQDDKDDESGSPEFGSVSVRQLRPRKLAHYVVQSDSDYEPEGDD